MFKKNVVIQSNLGAFNPLKTAIVHDWLYSVSGAEKVLEAIYQIFPSKVHTLIKNPKNLAGFGIPDIDIETSFIQRLPLATTKYPYYLPLFPFAIENFDLTDADLIISSSSCVAKGVLTHSNQLHICYCHTPMRYIWDLYFEYITTNRLNKGVKGLLTKFLLHRLRNWDLIHANRVDYFIANSKNIARRIEKTYRRKADVIYPPVNCTYFRGGKYTDGGFYLTAARLVPYKKVDVIVRAFSKLKDKKLVVVGEGSELSKLKSLATSNVEFVGYVAKEKLKEYFYSARAFIYMAYEDFGILPVEAQSAGLPVIAYGKGGVLETVKEHETGLFFANQTPDSLIEALRLFEKREKSFDRQSVCDQAMQFSEEKFIHRFKQAVEDKYQAFLDNTLDFQ